VSGGGKLRGTLAIQTETLKKGKGENQHVLAQDGREEGKYNGRYLVCLGYENNQDRECEV
jgi:hypothetical protein